MAKGKGKAQPRTGHENPKGEPLSLTSALVGGGWSTPRPGRFTPGKDLVRLYRRLGGHQDQSERVQFDSGEMHQYFSTCPELVKNLPPTVNNLHMSNCLSSDILPGGYPIAVKYIISYHITSHHITSRHVTSHHISYHIISHHIIYHIISVLVTAWNKSAPTGRIFMKFYISIFI